jgi:four helix bundle protein
VLGAGNVKQRAKSRGACSLQILRKGETMAGEEKLQHTLFRFQDFDVWKKAVEIGNKLFDIAEDLEKRKLYRFAEQLRGAGLSISNNISEGSGSFSKKEFVHFLNIARRSTFENANMIIVFENRGLISAAKKDELLTNLERECRMLTNFIKSLRES